MSAAIVTLLNLIAGLIPGSAPAIIDTVIADLTALIPLVIQVGPEVATAFQNVILALKTSGNVTDDQMTAVEAMSAQYDAAFDAAAKAAGLTDPPPAA